MMVLTAANFTKNCNATWTAGSGGGALDTLGSLSANTWYHVYLIERVDLQTTDVLLSTNVTTPFLPLPYTKKRRIGSIRTDASAHIIKFVQIGDQFLWAASANGPISGTWDIAAATVAASPGTLFTLVVPPGVSTKALLWVATVVAMDFVIVSPLQGTSTIGAWNLGNASVANTQGYQYEIWTNTNNQILVIAATAVASAFYLSTVGWVDSRGK
jgi:hypothetical protein